MYVAYIYDSHPSFWKVEVLMCTSNKLVPFILVAILSFYSKTQGDRDTNYKMESLQWRLKGSTVSPH